MINITGWKLCTASFESGNNIYQGSGEDYKNYKEEMFHHALETQDRSELFHLRNKRGTEYRSKVHLVRNLLNQFVIMDKEKYYTRK